MATIVSSSEFRTRMGAMLALADRGEQVVIKRNRKPSYVLSSVEAEDSVKDDECRGELDPFFTPAMLAEIDEALEEYYSGNAEVITCRTREDVRNLLKSL